eukprot:scaffold31770_cov157-Isochrysis_galbana.AAC.1
MGGCVRRRSRTRPASPQCMDGTCTTVRAVRGKTAHGPGAAEKKRPRTVRSAAVTEGLRRLAAGEYDHACLPLRSAP